MNVAAITDFKKLPMLYARHFGRHALLVCTESVDNVMSCAIIRLPGSPYDEIPFFGTQSFRINSVAPSEVVIEKQLTMRVSIPNSVTWPMKVYYIGDFNTYFDVQGPMKYGPEIQSMKLSPVHRFYRFIQPVGHFYTISQEEADSIVNGAAVDDWERPLNHTFRYEGVAFYAVHPHDYTEDCK